MTQHFQNLCRTANEILQSATRYSLILSVSCVALTYVVAVCFNIHDQQLVLGVKETSANIFLLIVGFYFGKQVSAPVPANTTTTVSSSGTTSLIPPLNE